MDFLYLQRGLESRPSREILYIRCTHIMRVLFCVFCMSIHWSPPYTLQTIALLLQIFFKDTLYFLLKYVLHLVLFTLTQIVLLLITSTFTRVQIQSNLGTTGYMMGGRGKYFHETFVRHHSNPTKYILFTVFLWLMIKICKHLLFLS
jgi:hypothetical protein